MFSSALHCKVLDKATGHNMKSNSEGEVYCPEHNTIIHNNI